MSAGRGAAQHSFPFLLIVRFFLKREIITDEAIVIVIGKKIDVVDKSTGGFCDVSLLPICIPYGDNPTNGRYGVRLNRCRNI